MREAAFAFVLALLVLIFGACGANQLRVAGAQIQDIAERAEVQRFAIGSMCSALDEASDRQIDLCIAAADTYVELVDTLRALADAIRAAEGDEDPNIDNVVELLRRAVILEHRLALILDELGTS